MGKSHHIKSYTTTSGELIGQTEDTSYEAVRLGPDAFLIKNGACSQGNTDAKTAAAKADAHQDREASRSTA